jgi:hypothetical protein
MSGQTHELSVSLVVAPIQLTSSGHWEHCIGGHASGRKAGRRLSEFVRKSHRPSMLLTSATKRNLLAWTKEHLKWACAVTLCNTV